MKTLDMNQTYTIRELSSIFKISRKATIRYLKHFNIPFQTKERFTLHLNSDIIKSSNEDLYNSMELTIIGRVKKPFYTIRDLKGIFGKTHSGMYRWLRRHKMPTKLCGNKTIILASVLLTHQLKSAS